MSDELSHQKAIGLQVPTWRERSVREQRLPLSASGQGGHTSAMPIRHVTDEGVSMAIACSITRVINKIAFDVFTEIK